MYFLKRFDGWKYAIITADNELITGCSTLTRALQLYRKHNTKEKPVGVAVIDFVFVSPELFKELGKDKGRKRI